MAWVFCSGMMRSGSTLQYQIAKTLVEGAAAGVGVGSMVPGRSRELLDRYDDPARLHVVKGHRYIPTAWSRLRTGEARSLYIYRDIRDVVVSMMHKESRTFREIMDSGFVEQLLEDDAVWSRAPRTLVSRYEVVTADVGREVGRIAAFLGLDPAPEEVERIAREHSLSRQKRRIERFDFGEEGVAEGKTYLLDPDTLLHHNHVRSGESGQWEGELTAEQVAEIEAIAGPWLVDRGYALSPGVSSPGFGARLRARLGRARATGRRIRTDLRYRSGPAITGLKVAAIRPIRRISDWLTSIGLATAIGGALYRVTGRSPATERPTLDGVDRVLVVRLDEIGDTVLTGPLLRELRRNLPDADITLVVNPVLENLVARCPYVDRVVTFQWSVDGLFGRLKRHFRALGVARRHLWPLRVDLALLPRWPRDRYHASFLTYFSGARHRVAYSETVTAAKQAMNSGLDRLFTRTLSTSGHVHEVERNLDLLRDVGGRVEETGLEVWVDEEDEAAADAMLEEDGGSGPRVALGIGAGAQRRVWPIPRYAELTRQLVHHWGARVVLLGGEDDRAGAESLRRQLDERVVDLVGRTTLRQAAAVLQRCDLYIGNDTGVMHLAAAAGVPVVEVSCHPATGDPGHDHSPVRFGPWGVDRRILQPAEPLSPCVEGCTGRVAHCITAVSVEAVVEAAGELLHSAVNDREPAGKSLH